MRKKFFTREKLGLFLLFFLAFILRLYRINNPIADWHSWRQADTAAVTRNFVKEGFTPLFPKFDSLHALNAYGEKNVHRYFFAEFPLYNILAYPFYRFFGVREIYSRLVSVFFSSLTLVFLYLLIKRYSSGLTAFLAAFFWAIIPYNIYYGRVTMPDPLYVFFSVLSLWLMTKYLQEKKILVGIGAGIFLALAILTKPYALFLGLPIAAMVFYYQRQKNKIDWKQLLLIAFISLVPYLLWKHHIDQYPEGQFGTRWLFNSTHIRFKGAFFHWILFERLNKLILGGGGFVLFFIGLLAPKKKKAWVFYLSWLFALALFIVIIATGNVTHDYYQLPLVPLLSALAAEGVVFAFHLGKGIWRRLFNGGIILSLVLMMVAFGWFEVRGFFNINNPAIVEAGRRVDALTPPNAYVIAPYNDDPAFLYQTNRYGWPSMTGTVEEMIKKGADYYVSVNFDSLTKEIMRKYQVIEKTDDYVIVKLIPKISRPSHSKEL